MPVAVVSDRPLPYWGGPRPFRLRLVPGPLLRTPRGRGADGLGIDIDDLRLLNRLGAELVHVSVLLELTALGGREHLAAQGISSCSAVLTS